uniref:Uncharacterized protein n=1 Tax=Moschus moschiferus TaxID=68415 RepID=A0A8C6G167_MOSMO
MLLILLSVTLLALSSAQSLFDEGISEDFYPIYAETTPTKARLSSLSSPTFSKTSQTPSPKTWTTKTSPRPTNPVIW